MNARELMVFLLDYKDRDVSILDDVHLDRYEACRRLAIAINNEYKKEKGEI